MKLFSKKSSDMSGQHPGPRLPVAENAFFWMLLLLLSIGCITSLYEKSLHKQETSSVSSESVFKSIKTTGRNYQIKERKLPIYCVKTEAPKVALTFDAAWGNEDTHRLMEILDAHNVKELGNHSENHKNMSRLDKAVIRMELQKVHDKVKKLTGKDMTLFRPPYGDYNNQVVEMADSMGYYPIQWDVDSLDWKDYGADSIVDMVLNNPHLGNGSIILMHNGAKYTPDALDAVITGLQEKGFELVTVSELIWKENFYLDQEGRQIAE